jgi:nucleotide-binding universal stress UspA family protein
MNRLWVGLGSPKECWVHTSTQPIQLAVKEIKMSNTKKIMVAVDFSEYSPKVADHAGRLAEDLGAELLFVNVINQRDIDMVKQVTMYTDKISVKDYVDGLKEERTEKMQNLLKESNCNRIPNRFLIKMGVPFLELINTAKEEKVDMVVTGTKGRGNIASMLLGSQAEKMFRHCPVPLLSIREKQD